MFPPHRISHRVRKISRMHRVAIEPVDMKSIVPKPLNNRDAPLKSRRLRLSSFWPPSHRTRDGSDRWLSAAARLGPLHRGASKLRKEYQGSASERGSTNRHSELLRKVREKRTSSQRCERPEQNSRSNLGSVTMPPIEASPAGT